MILQGFEMVRGLILDHELFSVENDLLTPTFKVKRKQAQDKYAPTVPCCCQSYLLVHSEASWTMI